MACIVSKGVPLIGIRKLIGTESTSISRRVKAILILSSMLSPIPRMPPLQIERPRERAWPRTSSRSSKEWVVQMRGKIFP